MALFFSAATFAGAFGGLLARGIMEMDGIAGHAGWAWIFIIEGLATVIVAAVALFALNDFPATAKFLTTGERVEVTRRLADDQDNLANEYKSSFVYDAFKDWKIWTHSLILIGYNFPLFLLVNHFH